MKISQIVLALLGLTSAHHRCDSVGTGNQNKAGPAIIEAMDKAKVALDAAQAAWDAFQDEYDGANSDYSSCQVRLNEANSNFDQSCGRVDYYNAEYERISNAYADCKPTAAGSTCTVSDKSVLSLEMVEISNAMIDNDNRCKTASNEQEQINLECNEQKALMDFKNAGLAMQREQLQQALEAAASYYQSIKDQYEALLATNLAGQDECKINQYNNDMAEIERLASIIDTCKQEICDEFTAREYDDIKFVGTLPFGSQVNGSINFPDCGPQISGECFWQNYQQSAWLDILSFVLYGHALFGCAVMSQYDYGFCFGNFAYVLVDSFAKKISPIKIETEGEQAAQTEEEPTKQ